MRCFGISTAAVLVLRVSAFAGDSATPPAASKPAATRTAAAAPAVTPGLLHDVLPGWLQIGGQVRGRFDGPSGIGYNPDVINDYYVQRVRMDLLVRPVAQLRFYVQAQ